MHLRMRGLDTSHQGEKSEDELHCDVFSVKRRQNEKVKTIEGLLRFLKGRQQVENDAT
jgi:hypothetical protein